MLVQEREQLRENIS